MTKRRSTKRALLSSVVALILCFSMLLGSTFAWFTDSTSSAVNTIQSGNLDVVLEYKKDWDDEWAAVENTTKLFNEAALYEPGYTEVVYLRVANEGNLALKYNLDVTVNNETQSTNVEGEAFKLSEFIEIGTFVMDEYNEGFNYADTLMPIMFGDRDAAISSIESSGEKFTKVSAFNGVVREDAPVLPGENTAQVVALVLTMPTSVGNEANHKTGVAAPTIELGVNLVATQYTHEEDSFDNQYDKDAEYPVVIPDNAIEVTSMEGLTTALNVGGTYVLGEDIVVDSELKVASDTDIYGTEDYVLTFSSNNSKITVNADTSLGIYGVQMDAEGTYSFDEDGYIVYDADARRTAPLLNAGAGSTLELGQGTVIENVVAKGSAVVSATGTAEKRATVILEGATIQNCAGESGAIINVNKAGDVFIEEGTVISGNASYNNNNHGIIRVYNAWDAANPSTVTMNGGEISGNYYSGNGLVGLYYGKMIMNGGEICDNSWFEDNQKHNGFYPVVYVHSNSQFEMNGGEISGNSVRFGVLNCLNSAIEPAIIINGGTVQNNTNTDNNKDAFAAALIEDEGKIYHSVSISEDANVTGEIWDYYTGYYTIEEYFEKVK